MVKGRHQRSKRKVSLKRIEKHVTDSKHVRSRTHRKESKRKISKGKSDQDSEIERRGSEMKEHSTQIASEETEDGTSEDDTVLFNCRKIPSSKLMSKFEERLKGSRFRYLNQALYVSTGKEALSIFERNEDLFHIYHTGYLQRMSHWSVQPVDVAVRWLKKQKPNQNVVDYGCGDGRILKANLRQNVTGLDLVALHPGVIPCDMAHSPLKDASQDIAIFSLSLMGTDYHRCLSDSARTLKTGGVLWIAEVCSRFVDRHGKEDYHPFFEALKNLGFERVLAKKPSPLFVVFVLKKVKDFDRRQKIHWPVLKPCLYKKR